MTTKLETHQKLTSEDRYFEAGDGARLAYCVWDRQAASRCRALVLILHGIGFHAAPYKVVAESLKLRGATFAALDLRGHGRSAGPAGEMAASTRVVQDIGDWVEHLQASFLGVPTFLIAESMSGPYGVLYALDHPGSLDGLILVAPAIVPSWRQALLVDSLSSLVSLVSAPSRLSLDLSGQRMRMGSNGHGFPKLRISDPDAIQSVSPRYLLRIGEAVARLMARRSLATNTPVLILHGEADKVLSPTGSRALYHRLKSPDKNMVILPGANHTLFWDQPSHAVFSIVSNWISGRIR